MDKGVTAAFFADHVFNELLDMDVDYLVAVAGGQGPLWEAGRLLILYVGVPLVLAMLAEDLSA